MVTVAVVLCRIFTCFMIALMAILLVHDGLWIRSSPLKVTAEVIAHHLHRPDICTSIAMRKDDTIEAMCWGAGVTLSYLWEGTTRNYTISSALPELYTKRAAERALLKTHAIGSSQTMSFLSSGECSLSAPPLNNDFQGFCVFAILYFATFATLTLLIMSITEWHECWCLLVQGEAEAGDGEGGDEEGGGGDDEDGDGTDNRTDEPLVASAPLP